MTFDEASNTELTFGKYRGRTLWQVLQEDAAYIDWLSDAETSLNFRRALDVFLKNPDVSRRIDAAVY